MIRNPTLMAFAIIGSILSGSALASPSPMPGGLAEAGLEQLVAMLQIEADQKANIYCDVRVPALTEINRRQPANGEVERLLAISNVLCADEAGDEANALELLGDYEQRFGAEDLANCGLFLANSTANASELDRRLRLIAQSDSPSTFASLDRDVLFSAVRTLRKANGEEAVDRMALEFASATAFPSLHDDLRNFVAQSAIGPALQEGRQDLATRMLEEVDNPVSFAELLVSREYEPIWPAIEARVGDHYAGVTGAYVEDSLAAYRGGGDDSDLFSTAAHALYYDGRWEDVLAFVRELPRTDQALAELEEGHAWAMNIEAYTLDALGRRAEADAVFDRLASLPADEKPWVVNYVINRGSRLVGQGR